MSSWKNLLFSCLSFVFIPFVNILRSYTLHIIWSSFINITFVFPFLLFYVDSLDLSKNKVYKTKMSNIFFSIEGYNVFLYTASWMTYTHSEKFFFSIHFPSPPIRADKIKASENRITMSNGLHLYLLSKFMWIKRNKTSHV